VRLRRWKQDLKGRKRHLLVDTEGFVLSRLRSIAQGSWTGTGSRRYCGEWMSTFPTQTTMVAVAGYRGEDKGKDWVQRTLGWSVDLVERPRKPAPKKVLMAWAEQWLHEGVVVDWEKLLPPKGFVVLPRRWVAERSFAWICHNRRMSLRTTRDYVRVAKRSCTLL
jgi:putative transposase